MKNVISFSLWGESPIYWIGAKKNIELAQKFFPGWICRIYIDKKCDIKLIESIIAHNVEIILVEQINSFDGMFWRFFASEDPEVDIFLSRDCDSRFTNREIAALNQWISSNKDFHIIRDHPYHSVPILGGLWGSRNGLMRKIGLSNLIKDWGVFNRKGIDQDFLGDRVYPLVWDKAFEHSEFNLKFKGETNRFPTLRMNYEFVGDSFDENDNRHPAYWKIIKDFKL